MPETPRQLPLELDHAAALSRDDLVASPANDAALALIERWPHWPSPVVVLVGPPGCGKTHLATIWKEVAGAHQCEPGQLAHAEPVHGALLIDGIDARAIDERGLFHLINAVSADRSFLLITARCPPRAWKVQLADLVSRLKAATVVEIASPDDLLLSGVITKLFADRQVAIEPHVVAFIVRRIERSLSTAIDLVDRLDRMALARKSRITRSLARLALHELEAERGSPAHR